MNVLIVEDDPNLRALWRAVLGQMDYLIQEAETVGSAKTALQLASFDLVLLDLYLGQESGLTLAIEAGNRNPDCKIVIITGSSTHKHEDLLAVSPAVANVLRKPVDVEDLMSVCEQYAGPAPARQKTS